MIEGGFDHPDEGHVAHALSGDLLKHMDIETRCQSNTPVKGFDLTGVRPFVANGKGTVGGGDGDEANGSKPDVLVRQHVLDSDLSESDAGLGVVGRQPEGMFGQQRFQHVPAARTGGMIIAGPGDVVAHLDVSPAVNVTEGLQVNDFWWRGAAGPRLSGTSPPVATLRLHTAALSFAEVPPGSGPKVGVRSGGVNPRLISDVADGASDDLTVLQPRKR
ncbi:hypothetical protein [Methylobacterium sp. R2-1]|uniref:hypothetical protein n=1 Tax=Methylobacterium sp. R2-1 TaxID=2587064 RepID=UPI00160F4E4E|nr:hypothetical protein [Methylobacterium sp. R2-1]MBB2961436.1 hypothetical protein [Methylobacterium sp. R2-1]